MSTPETEVDGMSTLLNRLLDCTSIDDEIGLVGHVQNNITQRGKSIHEHKSREQSDIMAQDMPSLPIEFSESEMARFVLYIFVRRFGWSEGVKINRSGSCIDLVTEVVEVKSITKTNKDRLDNRLDALIKWLLQQPLTATLVKGYLKLVVEASGLPIVRNRSAVHILSWLQDNIAHTSDDTVISLVNELLILILTDVWSAIRKVSSSRLGVILDSMSYQHQEALWKKLVEICEDDKNPWQKTDGAILGICAVVQHLHTKKDMKDVPVFVKRDLLKVVFDVISHSQLPIREATVKAITAYITLIDKQECVEILEQTMRRLQGENKSQDDESHFVDAYMAEGLLNISQSLIKILPLSSLLPRWDVNLSVFLLHLSHPASSVRQSNSCVFKLLVQKCSQDVALITQILHTLTEGWTPSLDESKVTDNTEISWQGREGRMLSFEFISTFLIKNHIRTMFNTRKHHKCEDTLQTDCNPSCSQSKSCSTQSSTESVLYNLSSSDTPTSSPATPTSSSDTPTLSVIAQMRLHDKEQQKRRNCTNFVESNYCHQNSDRNECLSGRRLLTTILYQTVECLADKQWELHRIAKQVLPCLAEVVRWFDCGLLQDIWQQHLTSDSSLSTYMSLFLLKESLYHCIRLEPLLQNTDTHNFKTPDLTDSVRCILECVTRNTARYLPHTDQLLARPCYDRLSVIAAEIIIMAHRLFEIDSRQKQSQSPVLRFWKRLFVFAHPSSRITRDLLEPAGELFSSPYEGYLSCCLVKPEGDSQCARQVEKVFVRTVCGHIQVYLSCLPWTDVAVYVPLLMYNVGLIIDDSQMCRTLLRCVSSQSRRVVDMVLTEESTDKHYSLRCVYFCLREAAGIVAMKSLDSQLLQKVLNIYLVLCRAIHPSRHLKMIFRGICIRLNKTSHHMDSIDLSPRTDNVSLVWQDSPVIFNTAEGNWEEIEEEEDIFAGGDLPAFYSECLSLNVSNGSGQFLTGRARTLSTQSEGVEGGESEEGQQVDEESDDWDSWSDEEQDDSSLSEMLAVFLTDLKQVLGQDGVTIFQEETEHLCPQEKMIIKRLSRC